MPGEGGFFWDNATIPPPPPTRLREGQARPDLGTLNPAEKWSLGPESPFKRQPKLSTVKHRNPNSTLRGECYVCGVGEDPSQTGVWLVTTVSAGHLILLTFHLCEILKVCVLVLSTWCGPGLGWELHPLGRTVVQRPCLLRTAVTRAGTTGRWVRSQESDIFPQTPQSGGPGSRRHRPQGFCGAVLHLAPWRRWSRKLGSRGRCGEGLGWPSSPARSQGGRESCPGDEGSGGSLAPSTRRSLRPLTGPSVGLHGPQLHSGDSRGPACWEVCGAGGGEGAPHPSSPAGLVS